MKKYCLNYKLLVLMILPALGTIFSVCFLLLTPSVGTYVGGAFLPLSLLATTILVIVEPMFYIMNPKAIIAIGVLKRYCISWEQVKCIRVKYDPFFNFLFVKDYVLIVDNSLRCSHRFLRIVKCGKTQMLINQYALIHGINIVK